MSDTNARALNWTEQGYVPDVAIRHGIRRLVRQRLQEIQSGPSLNEDFLPLHKFC